MRDAVKMARSKQYSMCVALALHLKPSPKRSESDPDLFLMTFNDKLALLIIIFYFSAIRLFKIFLSNLILLIFNKIRYFDF